MSLRYRYQLKPVPHSVLPLGGRWVRPRPVIPVTVIGPLTSRARDAVLDTGSDDSVFPEALAALIGVNLRGAPTGHGTRAAMAGVPLQYAQVTLRLFDGRELRQWPAWVGFTPVQLPYPTLGFAGRLQFFTTTFHGDHEEVELTVNRLYPGT